MGDLHAALAALVEKWKTEAAHPNGQPLLCQVYGNLAREAEVLLAEHEPTPSDQALRDLRAGVEALADEWQAVHDRWSGVSDGPRVGIFNVHARKVRALLDSSAPATASEGAEIDALRFAVAWWAAQWKKAREALASVADRLDEHTYDEIATVLDDEPSDHLGEAYEAASTASEGVEGATELARNSGASETFADELDDHITESMADPQYRAAHLASCDVEDCRWCRDATTASEGATEGEICLWANQICEQPNHHGCLTYCPVATDAAGVTSSDGDRGLSEEERHRVIRHMPAMTPGHVLVDLLADVAHVRNAAVDEAVAAGPQIVGATRTQPESTERVEWGVRNSLGRVISNPDWRQPADVHHWNAEGEWVRPDVVLRRTVTTYAPVVGPWEPIEDAAGGDDHG
ncbi:hypothetical protein KVF89_22500 [Nocardioides carbamazepini]|uniref:hypothetical protein n=1 Tax=Nocardioides carbamazepini TaxID=2854259 RepID=UPI002149A240|nr:hypothetical protein [Nocardioides carbamazepini]MCR1785328.1 hypothetical protein [Nocardioides carbamazepini]